MKKQILNIGKALNKAEQQQITGGFGCHMQCHFDCVDLHPNDKEAYGYCRDACWAGC